MVTTTTRNLEIKYLKHAVKRMKIRKITKGIVEEALIDPDKVISGRLNRRIALKRHKDKWIKVIFEEKKDVIVITAYWTRRIKQ